MINKLLMDAGNNNYYESLPTAFRLHKDLNSRVGVLFFFNNMIPSTAPSGVRRDGHSGKKIVISPAGLVGQVLRGQKMNKM